MLPFNNVLKKFYNRKEILIKILSLLSHITSGKELAYSIIIVYNMEKY